MVLWWYIREENAYCANYTAMFGHKKCYEFSTVIPVMTKHLCYEVWINI